MNIKEVDYIFGIDQTGAIKSKEKNTAKPLPLSILKREDTKTWKSYNFDIKDKKPLFLKSFSLQEIDDTLKKNFKTSLKTSKIIIVVDTVIGLPKVLENKDLSPLDNIRVLLERLSKESPGFGAKKAEKFFQSFLEDNDYKKSEHPRREVELKLNANSLFKPKPFQKNIQTGSYRILKELSKESYKSYLLYPFQKLTLKDGKPLILEGYPSLAWKVLNQSGRTSKDINLLKTKLKSEVLGLNQFYNLLPDHRDAAMLTFMAYFVIKASLLPVNKKNSIEGDILGSFMV